MTNGVRGTTAEAARQWDVFISNEPEDLRHAARLRHLLEQELRLTVFVDGIDPTPTGSFADAVRQRLRGRGVTFVIVSRHARDADCVGRAIALARLRRHRVVPVVFDDAGAACAVADLRLAGRRFLDGRRSEIDLRFAVWRCLYASLTSAA